MTFVVIIFLIFTLTFSAGEELLLHGLHQHIEHHNLKYETVTTASQVRLLLPTWPYSSHIFCPFSWHISIILGSDKYSPSGIRGYGEMPQMCPVIQNYCHPFHRLLITYCTCLSRSCFKTITTVIFLCPMSLIMLF